MFTFFESGFEVDRQQLLLGTSSDQRLGTKQGIKSPIL